MKAWSYNYTVCIVCTVLCIKYTSNPSPLEVFMFLIAIVHYMFDRRNNEFLYLRIAVSTTIEDRATLATAIPAFSRCTRRWGDSICRSKFRHRLISSSLSSLNAILQFLHHGDNNKITAPPPVTTIVISPTATICVMSSIQCSVRCLLGLVRLKFIDLATKQWVENVLLIKI